MDGPKGYHTKLHKLEKDKYHVISLICGIYKTEQMGEQNRKRLIGTENKLVVAEERGMEGWVK